MCTSVLPSSKPPVNQKIYHLNRGIPKLSLVMNPSEFREMSMYPIKCLMTKKLRKKIYLPISLQ